MSPTLAEARPARSVAAQRGVAPQPSGATGGDDLLLSVKAIEKAFGASKVLCGLSLIVRPGERVALLGPNGAGKTTMVRAISGRLKLDAGSIELAGEPIERPRVLDNLGVVPQELAIYADLSARENLLAFGRLHGLGGRDLRERVAWALEWIGLADRQHHLLKTFSGGMKRRVNIACGVLHRPRLLLLDEPTVGVDPQSRQRIFDMLAELHTDGTTILLTTHHLDEAESQCDRIVIMDHGQIIADGTLNELVQHTTGPERWVHLSIDGDFQPRVYGLEPDPRTGNWMAALQDISAELPGLIDAIRACGGNVTKLEVHEPSLHEVFLRLTGRELRE